MTSASLSGVQRVKTGECVKSLVLFQFEAGKSLSIKNDRPGLVNDSARHTINRALNFLDRQRQPARHRSLLPADSAGGVTIWLHE